MVCPIPPQKKGGNRSKGPIHDFKAMDSSSHHTECVYDKIPGMSHLGNIGGGSYNVQKTGHNSQSTVPLGMYWSLITSVIKNSYNSDKALLNIYLAFNTHLTFFLLTYHIPHLTHLPISLDPTGHKLHAN